MAIVEVVQVIEDVKDAKIVKVVRIAAALRQAQDGKAATTKEFLSSSFLKSAIRNLFSDL
jgi:hypothetical protein